MSKEIEELKEEIRAALQELSEQESLLPLLIVEEKGVTTPSKAVDISQRLRLSPKREEVARKAARLKKMVRGVDQGADFSKIFQEIRSKEFKMDKQEAIKKVQGLKKEIQKLEKEFGIKPSRRKKIKDKKTPGMKLATRGAKDSIDKAAEEFINTVIIPDFRKNPFKNSGSDYYDYYRIYPLDSWKLAYRIRLKLEKMNLDLHCEREGSYADYHKHPGIIVKKYKDKKKAPGLLKSDSHPKAKTKDKTNPSKMKRVAQRILNRF